MADEAPEPALEEAGPTTSAFPATAGDVPPGGAAGVAEPGVADVAVREGDVEVVVVVGGAG